MSNSWQRSWSIQGPKRLLQMSTFEISQLTYIFKIIMLLVIFFLLYSWVIIYRGVICCDHSFTSLKISSGLCGTVGKRTGRRISRMLSSFSPFKYKHHILFMFRKTLISLSLSICERATAKGICTFVTVLHICPETLQQFHIPKSRPHLKLRQFLLSLNKSTQFTTFNQEIWQLFSDSWWKSMASQITTFHA